MEQVIKTVIANQTDKANRITEGKEYKVLRNCINFYEVVNDDHNIAWVLKHRFESEHLSNAKRIASEAEALAERERVRNSILSTGEGWRICKSGMSIQDNDYEPNEYVKVLEQLREVLRVPEGENIVTHAKVVRALADALLDVFPGMKK